MKKEFPKSKEVGEAIASKIVGESLAACVNILPGVTSVYKWKGAVEKDEELLMMIKTRASHVELLTEIIIGMHPYDTPEVLETKIEGGSLGYMRWLEEETKR